MMIAYLARGSLQDILHEGFPEQQLQAYVAWVNSQLKKKAGVDPVQDLRLDLRDGVVLGHLIEIVAGEKLDGIHQQPNNTQEMKENVEQVLQFMASKKIRMHQTTSKDIVDGNLKSIMRIILTLAAHFKPVSGRSVNHNVQGATGKGQSNFSANHRPQSTTAMAQGAAAALADVRLDMSLSGRDISRYRQGSHSVEEEIGNPYWSVRAMVKQYEGHQGSASPSGSSGHVDLVRCRTIHSIANLVPSTQINPSYNQPVGFLDVITTGRLSSAEHNSAAGAISPFNADCVSGRDCGNFLSFYPCGRKENCIIYWLLYLNR
ncbi:dixin isoform X5 [Lithobates pipiens]